MADTEEATTPMGTLDNTSDTDSSDNEAPEPQVEWLATSRAKRSTAGTRMTSLIQQEAEDDELELLFAEDENDEGFEMEGGDDSDVQMDSSDDDDDQGPPAPGAEELDGEKELLRKERQERMGKKRKNDHLPKAFQAKNKKVKIDPMAPPGAGKKAEMKEPRLKKKSERSSWIPTEVDAPVRVSHRSTTMQAKEELYKEMQKREELRLKQLANMEKAAARKAAQKKPEKTQEDRLAEAARIEKANAKSLNRWEEAERIREEEARARLEALHNRKMVGPVITWWSGKATYVGDQLKQVGKNVEVVAPPVKVPRKKRPSEMGLGDSATAKARLERQQSLPKTAMQQNGQKSWPSSGPGTPVTPGFTIGAAATNAAPQQTQGLPLQPIHATPAMLNGSTPLSGLSAPPSAPASPFPQPQSAPPVPSPSPAATTQYPPPPAPPTPTMSTTPTPQNGNMPPATPSLPFTMQPSTATPQSVPQAGSQPTQAVSSTNGLYYNKSPQSQSPLPHPAAQVSAGPMPPSLPSSISAASANGPSPSPLNITANGPQAIPLGASPEIKSEASSSMPPPALHNQFTAPQQQQPTQFSAPQPPTNSAPPAINIQNALPQAPPPPPQPTTYATSNRLILSSFSDTALRDRSVMSAILFKGNKFTKLPRPTNPPLCAITGLPAKFKDPKTGLPYVNSYAFKEIRRLERGEYRWSGLLGAYVGGVDRPAVPVAGAPGTTIPGAARGVPNRFTNPKAPPPPKVVKHETKPVTMSATPGGGNMAPPPLPQGMPATPTPNGMAGQQAIMTPGQFAAQNPLNSPAQRTGQQQPTQNTSQAPKQPNPFMAPALNKSASPAGVQPNGGIAAQNKPFTMQPSASTPIQPQCMAQNSAQNKPTTPPMDAPAIPALPPPDPVAGIAATVAPIAATVAPLASTVAAVAPIGAPVIPVPSPTNNVHAPAASRPKA